MPLSKARFWSWLYCYNFYKKSGKKAGAISKRSHPHSLLSQKESINVFRQEEGLVWNSAGVFGNSAVWLGMYQDCSWEPLFRTPFLELKHIKMWLRWGHESLANACVASWHLILSCHWSHLITSVLHWTNSIPFLLFSLVHIEHYILMHSFI